MSDVLKVQQQSQAPSYATGIHKALTADRSTALSFTSETGGALSGGAHHPVRHSTGQCATDAILWTTAKSWLPGVALP